MEAGRGSHSLSVSLNAWINGEKPEFFFSEATGKRRVESPEGKKEFRERRGRTISEDEGERNKTEE